jgi:hypothetical protein
VGMPAGWGKLAVVACRNCPVCAHHVATESQDGKQVW